jgi:hypothetical protein
MGESKRRKANDPNYGKPNTSTQYTEPILAETPVSDGLEGIRGLIVCPPVAISGSQLIIKQNHIDQIEIRAGLLFFDHLVWPSSNSIYIASGPDERFLEDAGILARPSFSVSGNIAEALIQQQINAFRAYEKRYPGQFTLSQGERSLLVKGGLLTEGRGAVIELYRAVPVPDREVPLNEVLEFIRRRNAEMLALRACIDAAFVNVEQAENQETALLANIRAIDAACADAIRIGKEWKFPVRITNLKCSFEIRPIVALLAAIGGAGAAKVFGLPALGAALGVGLMSQAPALKLAGDLVPNGFMLRDHPYRYAYELHNELL